MTKDEVLNLALEALKTERDNYLEYDANDGAPEYIYEAITALEFLIAKQRHDKTVAWEQYAIKFATGKKLTYEKPENLPSYIGVRALVYADAILPAAQQKETVKLRRGDTLRCIETDELCTVWATSTTGKTMVRWGGNDFMDYTADQIGELFWLEPESSDIEIAAEQSDNYASFHAGVRFAKAHLLTTPKQKLTKEKTDDRTN